jgi:hypothetical protein
MYLFCGKYPGSSSVGNLNSDPWDHEIVWDVFYVLSRAFANDFIRCSYSYKTLRDINRFLQFSLYQSVHKCYSCLEAILDERRLEFTFEGTWFIDLKRLATLAGVTSLDRDPADYSSNSAELCTTLQTTGSPKFALPDSNYRIEY